MKSPEMIKTITAIRNAARPLVGVDTDYDPLMDWIGDCRVVLLGEQTHGTHEFYRERAAITKRLIMEKGFNAVALEADWPDSARVHRYIRGVGEDDNATEALSGFTRFPSWMWANRDMRELVIWLKRFNESVSRKSSQVGFYGLDLYSLYRSIEAVLCYLEQVDPEAARQAHYRYSCFEHYGEDPQAYGQAAILEMERSCEKLVIEQLAELQKNRHHYIKQADKNDEEAYFFAEQNARLIKDAESYYRSMFMGKDQSWNLRDTHMAETLDNLMAFLDEGLKRPSKVVVWAHNSHIGDARATEMGETGQINLGQLAKKRYGDNAYLVGFTTYEGEVTASSSWDTLEEMKKIIPALPGSYAHLFHEAGMGRFLLPIRKQHYLLKHMPDRRLERGIGVVYRPETEHISHYYYADITRQFDAVIHLDQTTAVEPLDLTEEWEAREFPETFPTGL